MHVGEVPIFLFYTFFLGGYLQYGRWKIRWVGEVYAWNFLVWFRRGREEEELCRRTEE